MALAPRRAYSLRSLEDDPKPSAAVLCISLPVPVPWSLRLLALVSCRWQVTHKHPSRTSRQEFIGKSCRLSTDVSIIYWRMGSTRPLQEHRHKCQSCTTKPHAYFPFTRISRMSSAGPVSSRVQAEQEASNTPLRWG